MKAAKRIQPVSMYGVPGMQSGVTLVEAMVAILVLSVLLGLGVPGFVSLFKNNRMVSTANELVAAMNLARSEAIKRNGHVGLCPIHTASTPPNCPASGVVSQQWENGWKVFYDGDKNGYLASSQDCADPTKDCELARHGKFDDGVTLRSSFAAGLIYGAAGTASQSGSSFGLCDDRGNASGRSIRVSRSGRPRVVSPAASCTP